MTPAATMLTELNAYAAAQPATAVAAPAAAEEPEADDEPDPDLEPVRAQTDTAALLRELSGLFASSDEGRPPPSAPAPAAPSTRPSAATPSKDDKKKKRGLFGR
jgi:hypothetical protein